MLKRVCPWCRSEIAREAAATCPVCDRTLTDAAGSPLREIDLRYDAVVARERERRKVFLIRGTPIAALVSLGAPLFHASLALALSVPLFMIAHGVAQRLYLVREPRRLLGRRRRFFARHIARWTFVLLTALGYAMTAIPVAGVLAGIVTFAGVTWLTQEHLMWSLGQERRRQPPRLWEKLVLAAIVLTLCGIAFVAATFGYLAWLLVRPA
jgi:hypothetical protein